MFGTKPKIDSKIRFQRRGFKRRLKLARTHKRAAVNFSANGSVIFKIISLKTSLIAAAAVLIAGYFIYLPNPLGIKKINISGLGQKDQTDLKMLMAQYFAQNKLLPRNNILLLNKAKLSDFLLARDPNLLSIDAIKKQPLSTLEIAATPRQNKYLLTSGGQNFIVSNDGFISAFAPERQAASASLTKITILDGAAILANSKIPNPGQISAIDQLAQKLPDAAGAVDHFELQNFKQSEIVAYLLNGTKLLFDLKNNLTQTLNKLHLLLTSIAPSDLRRLAYVDMRIDNRGYVCLKGAPCAAPRAMVLDTAASTASSTLPQ